MNKFKTLLSPFEIMEVIINRLNIYFPTHHDKRKGIIQLYLTIDNSLLGCYIKSDGNQLSLIKGISKEHNVSLSCTFFDWLELADKKLNPIWGVITRRLKFNGDKSFFKILPSIKSNFNLGEKNDPLTSFEQAPSKHWTSPRKVLIINASPRGQRGYTSLLSSAMTKGIIKGGAVVDEVFISKCKINHCTGCWSCWLKDSGSCSIKDDYAEIEKKEREADLIIYTFPLYADGMPAILKAYIDRGVQRLYPFMLDDASRIRHPRREKRTKSMAILSICGFAGISSFDALSLHFKAISINQHTPIVAELYRSSVMYLFNNPLLYATQRDVLNALEDAGFELVKYGEVKAKTKKRIEKIISTPREFVELSNDFWLEKVNRKDSDY